MGNTITMRRYKDSFHVPIVKIDITDIDLHQHMPLEVKCSWASPFSGDERPIRLNNGDTIEIVIPALTMWYTAKQRVLQASDEDIATALRNMI